MSKGIDIGHGVMTKFLALSREHGGLFSQSMVARSLNTSRQRVNQLIAQGDLEVVEFDEGCCCVTHDAQRRSVSRRWVTGKSLEALIEALGD